MKRKFLSALFTLIIVSTLTACSTSVSDKPILHDGQEISVESSKSFQPEESPESSETPAIGNYSNKVYYVGEDIPAGGYVINCTSTDYSMDVIVFAGAKDYEDFQDAEKFTVGEFSEALELHAWANFYLKQDEKAYVGLREGYIILLDNGQCEFNKYDPSASQTVYPGVYVVGEDIRASKINILCTSDYLQVTLFGDKEKYRDLWLFSSSNVRYMIFSLHPSPLLI